MIGYKSDDSDSKRLIITLEIPADAKTNLRRSNIIDPEKAKYRASKVKVLKIEDTDGNEHSKKYVIGEVIETEFDDNLENTDTTGICFYLDKNVAKNNGVRYIKDGKVVNYYNSGAKSFEEEYVNYELNGLYQDWYENGVKWCQVLYLNNNLHGLYQEWHRNGIKYREENYENGNLNGICREWDENGIKKYDVVYKNDVLVEN